MESFKPLTLLPTCCPKRRCRRVLAGSLISFSAAGLRRRASGPSGSVWATAVNRGYQQHRENNLFIPVAP